MTFSQNIIATRIKTPQATSVGIGFTAGTSANNLFTAGTNGSKLIWLAFYNADVISHTMTVAIASGGTNYNLGTVIVNQASVGTPNPEFLTANTMIPWLKDNDGQPYLFIPASANVVATSNSTIGNSSNGNAVYAMPIWGDF